MRHYFGYDINGVLRSIEAYGPSGWPPDQCLANKNCDKPAVTSLRERRGKSAPEVIDWVLFDCPCDPASGHTIKDCCCVNDKFASSYVDTSTKTLKTKPPLKIYVDGELIENGSIITRAPGTIVKFKLVSALMEDGETAKFIQRGNVDITLEDEWELDFSNGETPESTLVAPAQGTRGMVGVMGRRIRPSSFILRGFAS